MADNSLREQIILSDIVLLEQIAGVKTVKRTMQSYSDLERFAVTQFPVVAVVGELPVPSNKINARNGQVDQCISSLSVNLYVYLQANENADTEISSLLDDIWVKMYEDPTRSSLVMLTTIDIDKGSEYFNPFAAFKLTINHMYQHSTGGI